MSDDGRHKLGAFADEVAREWTIEGNVDWLLKTADKHGLVLGVAPERKAHPEDRCAHCGHPRRNHDGRGCLDRVVVRKAEMVGPGNRGRYEPVYGPCSCPGFVEEAQDARE